MTITASPDTRCKWCGKHFIRSTSMRSLCGMACIDAFANQAEREAKKRAKETKKLDAEKTRARRVALKSRRDWLEEAQKAFNRWTRARDAYEPCISCGKLAAAWGSWDAGHYLTVGARPELRFTPDNCHKQCVKCNQHLHGNTAMYRIGLIARIGVERVEALEGPHPPAKWSIDELKTMRDAFRILTKQELEKQ
jgi:hypothetical protein